MEHMRMESRADLEEWPSSLGMEDFSCKHTFESYYRAVGATLGWGGNKSLHKFSIYDFGTGQTYQHGQSYYERGNISIIYRLGRYVTQLGRDPWIIGGDWNMAPG
eukprot:9769709-Heterocapsa_arctica.AAC.1